MSSSTFNVNHIYNGVPAGMITSYIGTTSFESNTIANDPPGWVIANGVSRTNDGRYNNLITLGIGSGTLYTGTNTTYTPVNLKASMLRGISTQTYETITYGGPTLNSFDSQKTKAHTHGFTVAAHTHELVVKRISGGVTTEYPVNGGGAGLTGTSSNPVFGLAAMNSYDTNDGFDDTTGELNLEDVRVLTIDSTVTTVSINNNNQNNGDTFPVNFGVHWIIKL